MVKPGRRTSGGLGGRLGLTTILVGVVLLAAIGVVAYYSTVGTPPSVRARDCTPSGVPHEHASYAVFVDNNSVSWDYPQFAFPATGSLEGHIHQGASHTIHMEGGASSCTSIGRFLEKALLTRLAEDVIILDKPVHGGATYRDGSDGALRFFRGTPPDDRAAADRYVPASDVDWTEIDDAAKAQPADGEYFLVTFGKETDAAIRWQQRSIPIQVERE